MNNSQIIEQAAIDSGFFTPAEVERLVAEGKQIPFFTYTMWKKKGYVPREGCHGFQTKIWKKRKTDQRNGSSGEENPEGCFFKVKCSLFHESQVVAVDATSTTE